MIHAEGRFQFLREVKKILGDNPICLEIGVYMGEFSIQILNELNPEKLVLMDPFTEMTDPITGSDYYPGGGDGIPGSQRTIYSNNNCFLQAQHRVNEFVDKVIFDKNISVDAVNNYTDEFFDFIYIDAVHLYESVLWDLENYYPKLKKGGLMCGHDYQWPGVSKAVNEFCDKLGLEIIIHNGHGGDFALTQKP